ncbi:HlyD family type I secretion periplasmic adaptor subunit [Edwardsiella ictaluri]|uniref:HlyD family type I secretion periplasmic adaptor subunit n=2 Tax=Edwardsiella ictaluri TaxID=67780 RepID=UPI0009C10A89|nr:HlyD family type I secretion periplasmic adaptor subunit [Edwardsiella ictaluri]ARD38554.1 hypothetical protein B6E78_03330 [Edwardsiella ictaluri]AVZ83629.1 HlyD family type I secretion periplasmic adaptor subunit [Edwardsiella ictaluri]WJH21287.1 HlyD family type I secretion periplasmic adaptor subunit [Edwardsiella ictaluri]STP81039.1 Hemolysin secretion protein D, chromosomal [Edwardsiella ictaluri]
MMRPLSGKHNVKLLNWRNKNFTDDMAFLPSVIEVIESPPSPVRVQLLYTLCIFTVLAFAWSFFGRIDIIATAPGKVQPQGYVKVIESEVTGKVSRILLKNGDRVSEGETVALLDAADSQAKYNDALYNFSSFYAELWRRKTQDRLARDLSVEDRAITDFAVEWPAQPLLPEEIKHRETSAMHGELTQLNTDLQNIRAQLAQNTTREQGMKATIASQKSLIETLNERLQIRRTLVEKQVVSKDDWLQIMTDVKEAKSTLQSTLAQLRDIQAARDILQIALLKTRHDFISENLKNIGQVERQSNSLREQVNQREAQLALMTFKSPINGTIVASSLVSQGQVVTPGEELMRVVPDNSRLEIIAYVPNQDIGFIRPGQPVDVKINAFPYTRYGTLNGVVQHISQDAIPAADAQQVQMDPTRLGSNTKAGGGQSTQGLVFPLTVALEQDHILVGNQQVSLVSGMGVSVEIKTDRRRLIDYLVSPIYDLTSSSLRER